MEKLGEHVLTAEQLYTGRIADRRFKYALHPTFVYFAGTGWTMDDVRASANQAAEILSQCKIFIPQADLHVLAGPDMFKYFSDFIAKEIVRLVPLSKPTVYFVKDTLQNDRYGVEAIGKSNSNTRPTLRFTIWMTEDTNDPGIGLAHTMAQILMDERGHVDKPRNVMRPFTSPENVELTKAQCRKMTKVGKQNGLLRKMRRKKEAKKMKGRANDIRLATLPAATTCDTKACVKEVLDRVLFAETWRTPDRTTWVAKGDQDFAVVAPPAIGYRQIDPKLQLGAIDRLGKLLRSRYFPRFSVCNAL